ncbi:MAG: hypothetical protein RLZZ301_94 [Bacteroidota bacterium]|jgi:hypothetical protein
MKLFFQLFLFSLCALPAWAQRYRVELNLEKGAAYILNTDSKVSTTLNVENKEINTVIGVKGVLSFEVLELMDSVFLLEAHYDMLETNIKMLDKTIQYSSESEDEDDVVSQLYAALIVTPFQLKLSKTGKVLEVRDLDAILSNTLEQFDFDSETKEALHKQLSQSFNENAVIGNIELVTAIFPKTMVAVGDKWPIQSNITSPFPLTINTLYELKEVSPKEFVIQGTAKIRTFDSDARMEMNGVFLSYDLTGTISSEIRIERKSGWTIQSSNTKNMKGTSSVRKKAHSAVVATYPLKIMSLSTITNHN